MEQQEQTTTETEEQLIGGAESFGQAIENEEIVEEAPKVEEKKEVIRIGDKTFEITHQEVVRKRHLLPPALDGMRREQSDFP